MGARAEQRERTDADRKCCTESERTEIRRYVSGLYHDRHAGELSVCAQIWLRSLVSHFFESRLRFLIADMAAISWIWKNREAEDFEILLSIKNKTNFSRSCGMF